MSHVCQSTVVLSTPIKMAAGEDLEVIYVTRKTTSWCVVGIPKLQVLTADGKMHCTLLTASDGLKDPRSIAYRNSDNTLLVGCFSSGHLLSFQVTK